ncbi:RNA-directed DNA polymerase, eukaryota [Tanacetum coccineum]|uniref:RNA-directed DNA polymerase, eukaryota n=1 Tax=Tanacetum coccineum TaxID=301880 RepID=A0ABQ5C9L6_9ASTR
MMHYFCSNADHTRLISKSIFITNFPDSTTSKDLWNLCQPYGMVVDIFIPNRKSKSGKRFAFIRFIKVDNIDRLVGEFMTPLWIGRFHLHANVVRFDRPPKYASRSSHPVNPKPDNHVSPVVTSFVSAVKAKERIVWVDIEGVPLHAWSRSTFFKIGSKWGDVLELEDDHDDLFARKRLCVICLKSDHLKTFTKLFIVRMLNLLKEGSRVEWRRIVSIRIQSTNGHKHEKEVFDDAEVLESTVNLDGGGEDLFWIFLMEMYKFGQNNGFFHGRHARRIWRILWIKGVDGILRMICLSLIAQGLGSKAKKDWIRELITKHKVSFLSIQETKMELISAMDVKQLWASFIKASHYLLIILLPCMGRGFPNQLKLPCDFSSSSNLFILSKCCGDTHSSLIVRLNGECSGHGRLQQKSGSAFLPKWQILDGPFILSELLSWSWIRVVIISGKRIFYFSHCSPSSEFQFHRGMKQWGSFGFHFVYVLIMEYLHLSFSSGAVEAGSLLESRLVLLFSDLPTYFTADDAEFLWGSGLIIILKDWQGWFKQLRLGAKSKEVLEGVFYVSWWSLWNFKNHLLFADFNPRKDAIFDEIVLRSFNWCLARAVSGTVSAASAVSGTTKRWQEQFLTEAKVIFRS